MSTTESSTTGRGQLPAAWYPDPAGRHQLRWWDGDQWTDRVADGEEMSIDPPVPTSALPADEAPAEPEAEPQVEVEVEAEVEVEVEAEAPAEAVEAEAEAVEVEVEAVEVEPEVEAVEVEAVEAVAVEPEAEAVAVEPQPEVEAVEAVAVEPQPEVEPEAEAVEVEAVEVLALADVVIEPEPVEDHELEVEPEVEPEPVLEGEIIEEHDFGAHDFVSVVAPEPEAVEPEADRVEPEPEPEPLFDPTALIQPPLASEVPAPEPAIEAAPDDPSAEGGDELRPGRLPKELRPTTGGGASADLTPPQRRLILVAASVIALLCLGWGLYNQRSASQWQERGEELQAELDRQASNGDALQDAIGEAASTNAQLADGQQVVTELYDATQETVDQLNTCARDLNEVLRTLGGADAIARANETCSRAATSGEGLLAVLDQIATA